MNENLERKVAQTIERIQHGEKLALGLNPEQGYWVAFSGGKDSQVLLDLVERASVKYQAVYNVTSNDPPENVYFIRQHYPQVRFHHARRNFFRLVEVKGLPTIWHRFCCERLKEHTGAGYLVLTGVRAEESAKRAKYNELNIYSRRKEHADRSRVRTVDELIDNNHQCIRGKDKVMLYPLLNWTKEEVWEYIMMRHLPINPCYNLFDRVGCMFCPYSRTKEIEYYETRYPKFKALLLRSLQRYLDKRGWQDPSGLSNAEQYYDWWKSRDKLEVYLRKKGGVQ